MAKKKKHFQKQAAAPEVAAVTVVVKDACPECGSEHRATHNLVRTDSLSDSNTKTCMNRWHNSKP